jgi:hypothetical protein
MANAQDGMQRSTDDQDKDPQSLWMAKTEYYSQANLSDGEPSQILEKHVYLGVAFGIECPIDLIPKYVDGHMVVGGEGHLFAPHGKTWDGVGG